MEAYIVIDGKKADLTEEQLNALGIEVKKSPFKRVEKWHSYYRISQFGEVVLEDEHYTSTDNDLFTVANYCSDKELMQQRAYMETLNRLLWRYSMAHGGSEIDWSNRDDAYRIGYDYIAQRWEPYLSKDVRTFGTPYFATMEIAYSAIVKIIEPFMAEHPDFQIV